MWAEQRTRTCCACSQWPTTAKICMQAFIACGDPTSWGNVQRQYKALLSTRKDEAAAEADEAAASSIRPPQRIAISDFFLRHQSSEPSFPPPAIAAYTKMKD